MDLKTQKKYERNPGALPVEGHHLGPIWNLNQLMVSLYIFLGFFFPQNNRLKILHFSFIQLVLGKMCTFKDLNTADKACVTQIFYLVFVS